MSTLPPRSSTGCLTCKCRRKKCDETKPKCVRCQKSGLECPGYIYIQGKNKKTKPPRTLPAPREKKPKAQGQRPNVEAPELSSTFTPGDNETWSMDLSNFIPSQIESLEGLDSWPRSVLDDSFMGPHFMSNDIVDQCWAASTSSIILPSPPASDSPPMTSGQASLLNALFSLGGSTDPVISSTDVADAINNNQAQLLGGSTWPSPDTEEDDSSSEVEDPEG
ncbi:hypothetical protein B0J17DRAFT_713105 [Rhizoctonia solani]|nr:hypothetical protein B0J17DRAFT_713105 [Rhizoctonia solani]